MKKSDNHIEIVRSNIIGLSHMSQESSKSIYNFLIKHFSNVKITTIDNILDLENLVFRNPDLVFLCMEYIPKVPESEFRNSEKIWISTYFDEHSINYTGSSQIAHLLQRNKHLAKQRVLDLGLKSSKFIVIDQSRIIEREDVTLRYPLFAKPKDRGGGLGIDSNSVVYNFEQLRAKVRSITNSLHSDTIVEEYLPGREFSVAILKDRSSKTYSVMPIELVAPLDKNGIRILSSKIKSSNSEVILEVIDESIRVKVNTLAINVFTALGARDYGRIDIRFDDNDEANFIEANLIPSLINDYGSFPKACTLFHIDYETMIMNIVDLGLDRTIKIFEKLQPEVFTLASAQPINVVV